MVVLAVALSCGFAVPDGFAASSSRRQSAEVLWASVKWVVSPFRHRLHFPHHVQTMPTTSFVCFSPSLGAGLREVPDDWGFGALAGGVTGAAAGGVPVEREEKFGQAGSLLLCLVCPQL